MPDEQRKPTIDERLEVLVQSLELAQHEQERLRAEQERLDRRERRARAALLTGIAAYLEALNEGNDQDGGQP